MSPVEEAAIVQTAVIAYRSFALLTAKEKEAVLVVLTSFGPQEIAQVAEIRLYHLRKGDAQQMTLDSIMSELDRR